MNRTEKNLNNLSIRTDCGCQDLENNSTSDTNIEVVFRDLKSSIISLINTSPAVVGCVAWLTDKEILDALSKKECASVVVQKEDFLRPDEKGTKSALRILYDRCKPFDRTFFKETAILSCCCSPETTAIRCVGNFNSDKSQAKPRMHNKFLVFGSLQREEPSCSLFKFQPEKVWTGSFNLTYNASNSFENGLVIKSVKIAEAYFKEWVQIFALSEPLDWEHEWVAPEYRIGT